MALHDAADHALSRVRHALTEASAAPSEVRSGSLATFCPVAAHFRSSPNIGRNQIIALLATTLTVGHSRKSCRASGQPSGTACTHSHVPANNPCSASSSCIGVAFILERCWRKVRRREGKHRSDHRFAGEASGTKSQRTRYDGTRGGVGDHLTEHRARVFSRTETRLPLCADSNKIPHRTEVTRCAKPGSARRE
jgi:hypothetical protein